MKVAAAKHMHDFFVSFLTGFEEDVMLETIGMISWIS